MKDLFNIKRLCTYSSILSLLSCQTEPKRQDITSDLVEEDSYETQLIKATTDFFEEISLSYQQAKTAGNKKDAKEISKSIPSPNEMEKIPGRIQYGSMLLNKIGDDSIHQACTQTPLPTCSDQYLTQIVSLSWALFAKSIYHQDKGFTGGTIVVDDPNAYLFKFLLDYVKVLNKEVKRDLEENKAPLRAYNSTNCFAYPRHSTHFKKVQKDDNYTQYGIEMRYNYDLTIKSILDKKKLSPLKPELPSGKQHLLFGPLPNGKTFIKFENYGLCSFDGSDVKHLVQLFSHKSGPRHVEKVPSGQFGEISGIIKWTKHFYENNKKLQQNIPSCKKVKLIQNLMACAQELQALGDNDVASTLATSIAKETQQLWGEDTHDRYGDEVHLSEDQAFENTANE